MLIIKRSVEGVLQLSISIESERGEAHMYQIRTDLALETQEKMQEDKVNVQFFLDAETRAQLKELSRVRRLSTGEMLHDLIVEEYKRYRHSR